MASQVFTKELKLMGNRFQISVVASLEEWACQRIDEAVTEIQRIEELLTTFKETSETNLINRNAGIYAVNVCDEMFNLIERSIRISSITQGAFDISYGSIDKRLWNFDQTMTSLPNNATAKKMVRLINYRNIILDSAHKTVFLKEKGMRIGFGGIGKGYAAEMAKAVMKKNGVTSGIVNASGDLTAWAVNQMANPGPLGLCTPI